MVSVAAWKRAEAAERRGRERGRDRSRKKADKLDVKGKNALLCVICGFFAILLIAITQLILKRKSRVLYPIDSTTDFSTCLNVSHCNN